MRATDCVFGANRESIADAAVSGDPKQPRYAAIPAMPNAAATHAFEEAAKRGRQLRGRMR